MLALLLVQALVTEPAAAVELRRFSAAEAHQGVAAGPKSVYAIDNNRIGRYDKASGRRLGGWSGDPAQFKHINSCMVRARQLVCALSNYPDIPMASKVLWFDAKTLTLQRVRELEAGFGSLTWIDWRNGSWWACFAHYDGKGGEPGRDHRHTVLVRYRPDFKVLNVYRFPASVLTQFAPRSSSGGAWGSDGLLYVSGHDRPELYVLRIPRKGHELRHVATIATSTGGQGIGWDPNSPRRIWSIDRSTSELVVSQVPEISR
jgi:hypothetical protein